MKPRWTVNGYDAAGNVLWNLLITGRSPSEVKRRAKRLANSKRKPAATTILARRIWRGSRAWR